MPQLPNTVFCLHFCFLIVKIARGKKSPVSLMEHTYGSTHFLDEPRKCSQEANSFDVFYMPYILRQVVPH